MTKFQDELRAAAMYWCKFVLQNDARKDNSWKILESLISRAMDNHGNELLDIGYIIKKEDTTRKALELCHKEWQEEYQNGCYEGGYSSLVPANEALTSEYWIEKAQNET